MLHLDISHELSDYLVGKELCEIGFDVDLLDIFDLLSKNVGLDDL
jgi:hypothetical protein